MTTSNMLQRIRLLAEIFACGLSKQQLKDIEKSSGLSRDEVFEIFEANEVDWEELKDTIVRKQKLKKS